MWKKDFIRPLWPQNKAWTTEWMVEGPWHLEGKSRKRTSHSWSGPVRKGLHRGPCHRGGWMIAHQDRQRDSNLKWVIDSKLQNSVNEFWGLGICRDLPKVTEQVSSCPKPASPASLSVFLPWMPSFLTFSMMTLKAAWGPHLTHAASLLCCPASCVKICEITVHRRACQIWQWPPCLIVFPGMKPLYTFISPAWSPWPCCLQTFNLRQGRARNF